MIFDHLNAHNRIKCYLFHNDYKTSTYNLVVGTDVCVPVVFVWEKTRVPGRNPPARLGDHMTISNAHTCVFLCKDPNTTVQTVNTFLLDGLGNHNHFW